jgi:mannose-6-phosphate isomerase-like protein (cupin superfamily)
MNLKPVVLLAAGALLLTAQNAVDLFPSAKLKETASKLAAQCKKDGTPFASETLSKYGNNLTMLAYRTATGSSELHQKDADVFMVVEGEANILTGGSIVKGHTSAPNEIRGTGIQGGQSHKLSPGDVIHIQPITPHQLIIAPGHTFTYFVVKVTE